MHGNVRDTRKVHDVDELKQRPTKILRVAWNSHRRRNGWVAQTSAGVYLRQEGHFEHLL